MSFLAQFDAFHEQAMQATGLDNFGADDYRAPLRLLLEDYDQHAKLGDLGVQMLSGEMVGSLIGRLVEHQGFEAFSDYTNGPINKPLIIVGMTRTGTTALHRLICQDPATQSLPLWLGATPAPRPARGSWEANPYYQRSVQAYNALYTLNPAIRDIHPMIPAEPDECRFALNHSYWSPSFATTACVPNYAQWCFDADAGYAYREYRKVLGLVSAGCDDRWVLKDPSHLWGLSSLLEVFPDACIVMTYRDPLDSVASLASLLSQLRTLSEPKLTQQALGRQLLKSWGQALDRAEQQRKQIDPARILELHFSDIKSAPMDTLMRIYQHFDFPVSDQATAAWQHKISQDPREGHGVHKYTADQFGLTKTAIYDGVGSYYERYLQILEQSNERR